MLSARKKELAKEDFQRNTVNSPELPKTNIQNTKGEMENYMKKEYQINTWYLIISISSRDSTPTSMFRSALLSLQ